MSEASAGRAVTYIDMDNVRGARRRSRRVCVSECRVKPSSPFATEFCAPPEAGRAVDHHSSRFEALALALGSRHDLESGRERGFVCLR